MFKRAAKAFALLGASAALAIGGAGIAQASPDHGGHHKEHCKGLHGKQKRNCERRHHHDKHRR